MHAQVLTHIAIGDQLEFRVGNAQRSCKRYVVCRIEGLAAILHMQASKSSINMQTVFLRAGPAAGRTAGRAYMRLQNALLHCILKSCSWVGCTCWRRGHLQLYALCSL